MLAGSVGVRRLAEYTRQGPSGDALVSARYQRRGRCSRLLVRPWGRDRLRRRQKCPRGHAAWKQFRPLTPPSFLRWPVLLRSLGRRPLADRAGESDDAAGVLDVKILDQFSLEKDDALAPLYRPLLGGHDPPPPPAGLRRGGEGGIGR